MDGTQYAEGLEDMPVTMEELQVAYVALRKLTRQHRSDDGVRWYVLSAANLIIADAQNKLIAESLPSGSA
jgi:hypothetical protein